MNAFFNYLSFLRLGLINNILLPNVNNVPNALNNAVDLLFV